MRPRIYEYSHRGLDIIAGFYPRHWGLGLLFEIISDDSVEFRLILGPLVVYITYWR